MWVLAAKVGTFFFGEDIFKIVFGIAGGLIVFAVLEANGVSQTIAVQPWGSWWLAGQAGAGSQSIVQTIAKAGADGTLTTPRQPAVPLPAVGQLSLGFNGDVLLTQALSWLNVPYFYSGCSRQGIDCSCFVQTVLATVGIHAPRTTKPQVDWAIPVTRDQLRLGDLVFFDNTCTGCGPNPTHVGMYIGDGRMIQAGGTKVQISPVFTGYYASHIHSFGRPH